MSQEAVQMNNPQSLNVEMEYEKDVVDEIEQNPKNSFEEESIVDSDPEEENIQTDDHIDKPSSKRWERERKAREEKYQLTQALVAEKQRNLELQEYLSRSVDNNTMTKAERAFEVLDAAEVAHAKALESGDAVAAAKASTALIQANLAVERAANAKFYSTEEQSQQRENINPSAYASSALLKDWISDNPEFNEDSDSFNQRLVSKVVPLIDQLDAKLKRRGQAHLISSPLYFDALDTIIAQTKQDKKLGRPITASVSSKNYNREYSSNSKPVLTEQQRAVAAGCNMSDEQYINWLKKYEREKTEKQGNSYAF